jgi:hypothetical protein
MKKDTYIPENWNFICDICGWKCKSWESRHRWDGRITCRKCWETRSEADLFRIGKTEITDPPWKQPDPHEQPRDFCYIDEIQGLAGQGVAGCMIPNDDGLTHSEIPIACTSTFLLRYSNSNVRWENVAATPIVAVGASPDTYRPAYGTVTADPTKTLFGLTTWSHNLPVGTFTRNPGSLSWDFGGTFVVPYWPPTGNFTADFFVFPLALGTSDPEKGGWLYNDGGMGYAFVDNRDYTSYINRGANSVYIKSDGAIQYSQGKGQDSFGATGRLTLTTAAGVVPNGIWTHIALVRSGTTWTIYSGPVGGTGSALATGVETSPSTLYNSNPKLGGMWCQGRPSPTMGGYIGHLAEYRNSLCAHYSGSTYTVPSAPLTTFQ